MLPPLTLVAAGHVVGLALGVWVLTPVGVEIPIVLVTLTAIWLLVRRSGRGGARVLLLVAATALGLVGAGEIARPPPLGMATAVRLRVLVVRTPGPARDSRTRADERTLTVHARTPDHRPLTLHVSLPGGAVAPRVRAGEWWQATGLLCPLTEPTNPGLRDRRTELARRGRTQVLRVRHPDALRREGAGRIGPLRRLHVVLGERLRAAAGPGPARLLASLLLGDRDSLDGETRDAFTTAGIGHLLVVSGLHVLFLSAALDRALRATPWLGRRDRLRTACLGTVLFVYCGVCDFATPVVRAAVFVGMTSAAASLGRPAPFRDRLAPAVLCLLFAAPEELPAPGFQLSFAAVLALAFLREPLRNLLFPILDLWEHFPELVSPLRYRVTSHVADAVSTTLAAQLGTLPVLVYWFGEAHPWALAANLVAVPVAALLVPVAAGLAICGPLLPELTQPAAAWLVAPLSWIATLFAALPGARVRLPPATLAQVVSSGLLLLLAAGVARRRAWMTVCILLSLGLPAISCRSHRLRARPGIHVLDVGHGVAVLLRDGRGNDVLVDAGGRTEWTTENRLLPALRALGVDELASLWLSHGDHDHCSGLPAVLAAHPPRTIHVPVGFDSAPRIEEALVEAESGGTEIVRAQRGDASQFGGTRIRVLHPPLDDRPRSRNERSLVLWAEIQAEDRTLRALLPGDIVGTDLLTLAADSSLGHCDLLLLPHHGRGPASEQLALLTRVGPRRHVACAADARHVVVPSWITGVEGALTLTESGRFERTREFVNE